MAIGFIPSLDTPYAPAIVAFVIGFSGDRLPGMVSEILKKVGVQK
jgi:hypothetical protein